MEECYLVELKALANGINGTKSHKAITFTAKNTVISPNFLVWKFCGKAQFPHSFGRFTRNYAKTVPFHKIPIPGN